ncbi:MAG: exopolysaccharide Pel transporter PelG [Anaerocolumna sp.]
MAGIGFELKKIYKKKHIFNILQGIGYSTIVTVGPTLITIGIILIMHQLLEAMDVQYAERELLSSTILYVFIFSLIVTTPFNAVWSRYIADKLFQRKLEDILPAYYTGLTVVTLILAIISVPFFIRLYLVSNLGALFVFSSYCFLVSVAIVFFSMTFLTATKDYRIITIHFILGMLIALISGYLFVQIWDIVIIKGILYALTIGFFFIAVGEFTYIKKYFYISSGNYLESLQYIFQFKRLFFSGLFYILGLYCHNFVAWTTDLGIIVANSYISAPTYDMATFLAMLTNISTMVIFIVIVETSFHDRYQTYSEAVIRSTLRDIEKAKNDMFRLLIQQISYVIQVQAIITCILFLVVVIFLPSFGFSGIIMHIYPALTAGYFVMFIMYCNLIFLYYFNDMTGAFLTSLVFFAGVLAGSIIATRFNLRFYGMGAFFGAMSGWVVSFFRLYYLEKHFDAHIFRKGRLILTKKENMPSQVVYKKELN